MTLKVFLTQQCGQNNKISSSQIQEAINQMEKILRDVGFGLKYNVKMMCTWKLLTCFSIFYKKQTEPYH